MRFRCGALDLASAGDAWNYQVQVNGEDSPILMLFYNQVTNEVVISLPEGSLRAGDTVSVAYNLRTGKGETMTGSTGGVCAE